MGTDMQRMDKEYACFAMLRDMGERGVEIYIDGKRCDVNDLSNVLRLSDEKLSYMGDFISDEKTGILKEIHFDRIDE